MIDVGYNTGNENSPRARHTGHMIHNRSAVMDTSSIPQKRCTKCGTEYPATLEFFYKKKNGKYGLFSWCKRCHTKLTAPNSAKWSREHPEPGRARSAKWSREHPERIRERAARRRRDNPVPHREYQAKWMREHPAQRSANESRRRARKINLSNTLTTADWQRCLKYFDYKCAVCGRQQGLWHTIAADHWIPLSSPDCPGTIPTNIVPLCHGEGGCNNSKGNRDANEWLVSKFGERKAGQIRQRVFNYFMTYSREE